MKALSPLPPQRKSDRFATAPAVSENSVISAWAQLMVMAIRADIDVATLRHWAEIIPMSVGTLRSVCRTTGVTGKRSLDLARVLRAVIRLEGRRWMPQAVLTCRDQRTLRSLLRRTGCRIEQPPLTASEFLDRQIVFPQGGVHLQALRKALGKNPTDSETESPNRGSTRRRR